MIDTVSQLTSENETKDYELEPFNEAKINTV